MKIWIWIIKNSKTRLQLIYIKSDKSKKIFDKIISIQEVYDRELRKNKWGGIILKKQKKSKGITLIVLVITIVILLILAGITIATITSDNGILKNSVDAKVSAEISTEKEMVQRAVAQSMGQNSRGLLEEDEFRKKWILRQVMKKQK